MIERRPPGSIAAVRISRRSIAGILAHRAGTEVRASHAFSSHLSADVLTAPTDLAGAELRNVFLSANIRTRGCLICLPAEWFMVHSVELPEIEEQDIASYLELEAERVFPFAPSDLSISVSRYRDDSGRQHATLAAISNVTLSAVVNALQRARCNALSITTLAAVLAARGAGPVSAALLVEESHVEFAVACDGGVAVLRSLPLHSADDEGDALAELAREIRITLRRLPLRTTGTIPLRIHGRAERVAPLVTALAPLLHSTGVVLDPHEQTPVEAGLSSAAANVFAGRPQPLEFARPQLSLARRLSHKFAQRGLLQRVAIAAIILLILTAGVFAYRQLRISHLEHKWLAMEQDVRNLEATQDNIRKWRDWFDDDTQALELLKNVTLAFPETGIVWARTLQIENQTLVTCAGFARSNDDCIAVVDALRKTKGIEDLKLAQVRGDDPVQFSFSFRWSGSVTR